MISKEHLLDLIEDYASAKTTGRPVLIQGAIMRLNQAVELMFAKQQEPPHAPQPVDPEQK